MIRALDLVSVRQQWIVYKQLWRLDCRRLEKSIFRKKVSVLELSKFVRTISIKNVFNVSPPVLPFNNVYLSMSSVLIKMRMQGLSRRPVRNWWMLWGNTRKYSYTLETIQSSPKYPFHSTAFLNHRRYVGISFHCNVCTRLQRAQENLYTLVARIFGEVFIPKQSGVRSFII